MADAGRGRDGAGSGSEAEAPRRATNTARGANAACFGADSRAEPFGTRRIRQDRDPKAYMYTPSGRADGEAARPDKASTVAAKQAARRKAQHSSTVAQ